MKRPCSMSRTASIWKRCYYEGPILGLALFAKRSSGILLSIFGLAIFMAGCATGPRFEKYSATLPPPAPGQGRIWFYRPSKMVGEAVQPYVYLNGTTVGKAQPGCYFYVDRPPGIYQIKCTTEWSDSDNIYVATGDEKFIRL